MAVRMSDVYDVVVIGSGTGGYSCALRAAQLGKRVAIVERDERLGGTCLLRGCIPTKALLQSAAVMDTVNRSEEWGIKASGEPDWTQVQAFETKIVDKLVSGLTGLVKARKIDVIRGSAVLQAGPAVQVDGADDHRRRRGRRHRVASQAPAGAGGHAPDHHERRGAVVRRDPVVGGDHRRGGDRARVRELLPLDGRRRDDGRGAPARRAARGRGPVQGDRPRVPQARDRRPRRRERDRRDGLGRPRRGRVRGGGTAQTVTADVCLVAVGRGPVTDGLGLEEAGVELDRGFVKVDGQLQTTAAHVWAIGDVAATPLQLAHVSFTEGYAVAERIAGIPVPEIDYTQIPRVTYCSPEIASVGITEAQAVERGHEVEVERFNFQGVGKANIVAEGGLIKIVAAKDGPVLGVHMVGPHVTDLISESMLAVAWEAVPAEVAALIHPHPTLSEGVGEAFLALAGKPLHGA